MPEDRQKAIRLLYAAVLQVNALDPQMFCTRDSFAARAREITDAALKTFHTEHTELARRALLYSPRVEVGSRKRRIDAR